MRRVVVLLVAGSLAFTLGEPARADRPIEETSDFLVLQCQLSGEAGQGSILIETDGESTFVEAAIWFPGSQPFVDVPDLISDFETAQISIFGDQVMATIPMTFFESGDPNGTLNFTGAIGEQIGEDSFSDRFREGNRWVEVEQTSALFETTASVDLEGSPLEAECSAERIHSQIRATNPRAIRIDLAEAFVECFGIVGTDDSTMLMFAGEFGTESFLDLQLFAPGDSFEEDAPQLVGSAEIGSLSGTVEATVPLFDPFDEGPPIDQASIRLTVTEGVVIESDIVFQGGKLREVQTELITSGLAEIQSDGRSYDLSGCNGSRFDTRGIVTNPAGPQEKGRPPSNDLPTGAVSLDVGERVNQQTKATAIGSEAPCSPMEDVPFDIFGRTLWYSIEGTGEAVTMSTAGSDFDTVLAVYDAGDLTTPLDCIDDVFVEGQSRQAELSWVTVPGVTYLVQIGGFAGQYGLLKVSVAG